MELSGVDDVCVEGVTDREGPEEGQKLLRGSLGEVFEGFRGLDDDFRGCKFRGVDAVSLVAVDLILDPEVGFPQAIFDRDGGSPAKLILNHGVVRVATPDTLGPRDMFDGNVFAFEGQREPSEGIHIDHFVRP